MRRKRRTHSPEFKAKVALAACQGDLTMAEMVKKFDVHANQITDWKKQLLSGAPDVFGKGAQKAEATEETIELSQNPPLQWCSASPQKDPLPTGSFGSSLCENSPKRWFITNSKS